MSGPRITCLISANGLGHYRRSIGLLDRLCDRCTGLQVCVLCEDTQVERASFWDRSRRFWDRPGVARITGVLPGKQWPLVVDQPLLDWVRKLAELRELRDSDIVLSDNLAGVLAVRPDAILVGSFLWSDVLAGAFQDHPGVKAFVEQERDLLAAHRPKMLCIDDIVMPGVVERTDAIRLPWMCEVQAVAGQRADGLRRIAVIGGATGAADSLLAGVVAALIEHDHDREVSSAAHLGARHTFGFTPQEYASLDVVVCRPGIGTITDCVAQRVPMIVLHEGTANLELMHNGRRLAELGFARDVGADPGHADVIDAVERVLDPSTHRRMRDRLSNAKGNGFARAVEYLGALLGEPTK